MKNEEFMIDNHPVLGEEDCGQGKYALYVQYIRTEGRYMIMYRSDDREKLNQIAERINDARHLIVKQRKDKENVEAYVL